MNYSKVKTSDGKWSVNKMIKILPFLENIANNND